MSAILAVGLIGVAGGTATAEPDLEACAAIETTIQGQLENLSHVDPALYPQVAPDILASVRALRMSMEQSGCPTGPSIESMLVPPSPKPAPTPFIPAQPLDECGQIAQEWAGFMDNEPLLIPVLAIMGADVLAFCDVVTGLTNAITG
ncbi:hypothetical protein ACWEKT_35765 [Nocardia takedensis]